MLLEWSRSSQGGARLPRRSAESRRWQTGASPNVRDPHRPACCACKGKRIIPTIAAMIRSRCERSHRAKAKTAIPRTAPHAIVVPSPRSTDPPNASSSPPRLAPARCESSSSIDGTAIEASSTIVPTKNGAVCQPGGGGDASVRFAAASQQRRSACRAMAPARIAATTPTSPREA